MLELESTLSLRSELCGGAALPEDVGRCARELCFNIVACDARSDDAQVRLANVSAQCLANLTSRGELREVWLALSTRDKDRSPFEVGLASPAARRYVSAAAHNCLRSDNDAARRVCEDANFVAEILDTALNCSALRSLAGLGLDDAKDRVEANVDLTGDAEWLYLLLRALLNHPRHLTLLFRAAHSHIDQHMTTLRREFLLAIVLAAESDEALSRSEVEVESVELGLGEELTAPMRSVVLRIVAEVASREEGVLEVAERLVAAGALNLAARSLGPAAETAAGDVVSALAVVANVCHSSALARDQARETGVIPLVLNRCSIDDRNPLQREWAVFATRSLTTDNEANREYIASLTAQEAAASNETLRAAGVTDVQLDPNTRRPVLTRKQKKPNDDSK